MRSQDVVRRALRTARGYAQDFAEAVQVHEVVVTRPTEGRLDANNWLQYDNDEVVYSGRARLTSATGPVTYTIGDEIEFFSSATAFLPLAVVAVRIDDLLQVTGHDDPAYVGLRFRVVDVEATGVIGASRKVQLVGVQRSKHWTDETVARPTTATDSIPPEWRLS